MAPVPPKVVTKPCPAVVAAPPTAAHPLDDVAAHQHSPEAQHAETAAPPRHPETAAVVARPRHSSPYHVHIVVFTYRRLEGLKRLLQSLVGANYHGDDVSLSIFLDYPKKGKPLGDDGTRKFVAGFKWPHGRLNVHRRLANAGLKRTIMEAWFPPGDDSEVAAFFEDDIEVSPFWYLWAAAALRKYADPAAADGHVDERLLGISLFRPIHDELSGRGCRVSNGHQAFALQQPCSWGALYLPRAWRAFRDWYDEYTFGGDRDPRVTTADGGAPSSNGWDRHSSWKKYLIKLMHDRGWFMVYPNPPARTVLATNHLMEGEHPTPSRKLFELPLLARDSAELTTFVGEDAAQRLGDPATADPSDFDGTLPALPAMKAFDVLFRSVPSVNELPRGGGGGGGGGSD